MSCEKAICLTIFVRLPKKTQSQVTIGPQAKQHLNCVLLTGRWDAFIGLL